MIDNRQLVMGIGARVAVPREVLAARGNPLRLERPHDRGPEARHVLGGLSQRAIADDRVPGIGVNVEHGGVVERDPHGLQLGRERPGEPLGQRDLAAAPEGNHRRPHGERRFQARDAPAFLIDTDPERDLPGERLRFPRELGDLLRAFHVAREQNDAAQVELARQALHLGRDRMAVEPDERELPRMAAQIPQRHRHIIRSSRLAARTAVARGSWLVERNEQRATSNERI